MDWPVSRAYNSPQDESNYLITFGACNLPSNTPAFLSVAAATMAGQELVENFGLLFAELCNDSVKLHNWLIENNLIPSERICFKCNKPMAVLRAGDTRNGLGLFKCLREHPRGLVVQEPVSNDTWFQESTFPSDIVLELTFYFSRKHVFEAAPSEAFLKLKLPDRTIADWYSLCRQVCMASLENPCNDKIGGPGVSVEIDQFKVGRLKYKTGSLVQGSWVVGILGQDGSSRFAIYPDKNRSIHVLVSIIKKHVEPGSEIVSNSWKLFEGVTIEDVQVLMAQNSYTFKELISCDEIEEIGAVSNQAAVDDACCKIESRWHSVKQVLLDKGVRTRDLAPYLCEYIWRRNAKSRGSVFKAFIQDIAKLYPTMEE